MYCVSKSQTVKNGLFYELHLYCLLLKARLYLNSSLLSHGGVFTNVKRAYSIDGWKNQDGSKVEAWRNIISLKYQLTIKQIKSNLDPKKK